MKATRTVGIALGILGLTVIGAARTELTNVESQVVGDGISIRLEGRQLSKPKAFTVSTSSAYIVEFAGHLVGKAGKKTLNTNGVRSIEWGWYTSDPPKVRVAVRLSDPSVKPKLTKDGSGWIITVGDTAAKPPVDADREAMKRAEELLRNSKSETEKPHSKKEEPANKEEPAEKPFEVKTVVKEKPDTAAEDRKAMDAALKMLQQTITVRKATPAEVQTKIVKVEVEEEVVTSGSGTETDQKVVTSEEDRKAMEAALKLLNERKDTGNVKVVVKKNDRPAEAATPAQEVDVAPEDRIVTLDFVNTDILQILKAMSLESGVNIVASPDVSPADAPVLITARLSKLPLKDALTFVAAMGNIRFAMVRETYVVANQDSFNSFMRQLMDRGGLKYETHVVNLKSGEAERIKEAVLAAMPQDGEGGYYEVIVQQTEPLTKSAPAGNGSSKSGDDQGSGETGSSNENSSESSTQTFTSKAKARYLMVVGEAKRVKEVSSFVRDLDNQITESFSVRRSNDIDSIAVPIQSGDLVRIKTMIGRMIEASPRAAEFTLSESALAELSQGDEETQVLLMIGPKSELAALKQYAVSLDESLCELIGIPFASDYAGLERLYEVVELNFIEPMIAEFDLKGRVRGLHVTVLPDPVTPGISGSDAGSKADAPGEEAPANTKTELDRAIGREPMKLLLRGTKQQINEAKDYLAMVDVAPRQVALELRVLELTKEDAKRLGLDWTLLTGGRVQMLSSNQGAGSSSLIGRQGGTIGEGDTFSFTSLLDETDFGKKLIARPNALVSDGRTTNLFVGDTIRYIESIISSQNGPSVQTADLDVGVTFNIMARIGGGGNIALDLDQRFTLLEAFTPVPGGGNLPQTNERRTSMHVNMVSGETLALGGLILDEDRQLEGGIPFLKDLPIIGLLFKRSEKIQERTEIVFFLSAVEIDRNSRANAASPRKNESEDPDIMDDYLKTGGQKKGDGGK
jgi:type II secretory pathway component GspD/PulD (secretin)